MFTPHLEARIQHKKSQIYETFIKFKRKNMEYMSERQDAHLT